MEMDFSLLGNYSCGIVFHCTLSIVPCSVVPVSDPWTMLTTGQERSTHVVYASNYIHRNMQNP
jgi:hypothetical protein